MSHKLSNQSYLIVQGSPIVTFFLKGTVLIYVGNEPHVIDTIEGNINFIGKGIVTSEGKEVVTVNVMG